MLANADEENGHVGRMHDTNEGSHHVANCIALGNDEPVKVTSRSEGGIEVASLGYRICSHESLQIVLLASITW